MSIFTKIIVLFLVSFSSMIFVSYEINKMTDEKVESDLKNKYLHVSNTLLKYLYNINKANFKEKLNELEFKIMNNKEYYLKSSVSIYKHEDNISTVEILKYKDTEYLLYMKYLDSNILITDILQKENFEKKEFLNYFILANIIILVTIFIILLKMTYPLREVSKTIKKFGEGQYCIRIKTSCKAEIGELANTFDLMAENIEALIVSRQRLLRDIGHELKTPIAKSKIALAMIDDNKYKKILNKALYQIDNMTSELLCIEKLNANQNKLQIETFNTETLISESLSRLFIEDETTVEVLIKSNFKIDADIKYLSIALKNLIDNGLKYTTQKPIYIIANNNKVFVKSKGEKLNKPLEFLCEAFTQGDNSRTQSGYGLGLSLVSRILDKHNFKLSYFYNNGLNIFVMNLK